MSKTKSLVVLSLCSAILVIAQVTLAVLPNIELVTLLCIIYTLFFRTKALAVIYVFVLVEGLLFGFGLWWINYLYVWTVLWGVVMLLSRMQSMIGYATVAGLFGLFFGMLTAIPYLFIGGLNMALSYWVNGIAFDITHAIGNVIVTILLYKPLWLVFKRAFGVPKSQVEIVEINEV